jgi:hypothetical protein
LVPGAMVRPTMVSEAVVWEESVKLLPAKLPWSVRTQPGSKPAQRQARRPRHWGHAIGKGSLTFNGIGLLLSHYLVEEVAEAANT